MTTFRVHKWAHYLCYKPHKWSSILYWLVFVRPRCLPRNNLSFFFTQLVGSYTKKCPNRPSMRGARSPVIGFGLSQFAVKMIGVMFCTLKHSFLNSLRASQKCHLAAFLTNFSVRELANHNTKTLQLSHKLQQENSASVLTQHITNAGTAAIPQKHSQRMQWCSKSKQKIVHNNGLVGGFNSIENYSYHKYKIIP